MSRPSQTRSRADKPAKGAANVPTPAATHDIVPGKFNEHDWNVMLDRDEGDEGMGELVEEIVNSAMDVIYANYIERQLLPYTITQAKDAILQIVEWQFLSRDEGEKDPHMQTGWQGDEEPIPAVTDCWAQGSVPRQAVTPRAPVCIHEEDEEPAPAEDMTATQQVEETADMSKTEAIPESNSVDEETSRADEESYPAEVEEGETQNVQHVPQKPKSKKKFRPYGGPLRSAKVSKMTESLEEMERQLTLAEVPTPSPIQLEPSMLHIPSSLHSMLKLQSGRPPGSKDVMYDDFGNVVGVVKIDPNRLPSHSVKVRYQIVDPLVEAAQARLEAMRTGCYSKKSKGRASKTSKDISSTASVISARDVSVAASMLSHKGATPLPCPLIDSMEVSPGVVVREGDRVKRGPKQHPRKVDVLSPNTQQSLRPVVSQPVRPHLTVAELLENQTPYIKPMRDIAPIPPIVPHSPHQVSSR